MKIAVSTPIHWFGDTFKVRLARSWPVVLIVIVAMLLFAFLIRQVAAAQGVAPETLTKDPNAVSGLPSYVGTVTYLCLILWSAAASFSFMGAVLLPGKSRRFWFLLCAGAFTGVLMLDDAFSFHLTLIPNHSQLSENIFYFFYVLFILAFLLYFLRDILNDTDYPILGAALFFMVLSMVLDLMLSDVFIADILKLSGIALWLAYFCRTAVHFVNTQPR